MPLAFLTVIAVVVLAVVVLFLLGLLAPRLSRRFQRRADADFDRAERASRRAPGLLGRWLGKSFEESEKVTDATSRAGRRAHDAVEDEERKLGS